MHNASIPRMRQVPLPKTAKQSLLLIALLGGMITACSSAPSSTSSEATPPSGMASSSAPLISADRARETTAVDQPVNQPIVPRSQPQLAKTGSITLTVDSVQESLEKAIGIARQQQGDLLGLQDQSPDDPASRRIAVLQIRVLQQNLDATLKALTQLGTVQQQTIAAEDVSSQLVDYGARLRNLRKTESTLLEIMDRSGGMNDVLKVAQELGKVRDSIEQVDAQVKNLQNRVAYSTLSVTFQEAIATVPPQPALGGQMQETWEQATRSVSRFTVGLMKLGLWLLVYSPYWLVLMGGAIAIRRWRQPPIPPSVNSEPPTSG